MWKSILLGQIFLFAGFISVSGQTPVSRIPPADPVGSIAIDLSNITRSVQTLSDRLKAFVDKWEKVGGLTLTEKQQKLVLGMELLGRAEQRVATLQKSQIELTEKLNESRAKLSKVDTDLRPRNIENSVQLEGTTEATELRESRRLRLQGERTSLSQLTAQIQQNLSETGDNLREAQSLADRLRRMFLPQIERELYDQ